VLELRKELYVQFVLPRSGCVFGQPLTVFIVSQYFEQNIDFYLLGRLATVYL